MEPVFPIMKKLLKHIAKRVGFIVVGLIIAVLSLPLVAGKIEDVQRRNKSLEDSGNALMKIIDLNNESDGLPLEKGELINSDADEVLIRFPRKKTNP